jgi:VWFA-related protein
MRTLRFVWASVAISLLFAAPLAAQDAQQTIKSDVDVVSVYFTVRDSHHALIGNLDQGQFRVTEDGHPQAIRFFAHHSDVPLDVGVLLDTGTSTARTLDLEAEATSLFFDSVLRRNDLGFIVSYAAHIDTIQVPTADVKLLREQARTVRPAGSLDDIFSRPVPMPMPFPMPGTGAGGRPPVYLDRKARLYDAARIATFRYLKREIGRKAMLIVALSDDQHSESTLEDALIALQQGDVIAYVLQIYDGPHDNCDIRHIFVQGKLKKLAEETGGRLIEVRGMEKMSEAFAQIAEELHNQYSLGYYPQNTKWDGNFRKISIEAKGYNVTSRKGYYALPPGQR